jgi:hypothetical protein
VTTRRSAELAARRLAELGYPPERVERVSLLVRHHMARFSTEDGARRFLERVGDPGLAADVLVLREADERGKHPEATAEHVAHMRELLADATRSEPDAAAAGG